LTTAKPSKPWGWRSRRPPRAHPGSPCQGLRWGAGHATRHRTFVRPDLTPASREVRSASMCPLVLSSSCTTGVGRLCLTR
jgi:hypothetical protein